MPKTCIADATHENDKSLKTMPTKVVLAAHEKRKTMKTQVVSNNVRSLDVVGDVYGDELAAVECTVQERDGKSAEAGADVDIVSLSKKEKATEERAEAERRVELALRTERPELDDAGISRLMQRMNGRPS
jgi:hypothetical protein